MTAVQRILVIKLSALGDFVLALSPMAAIRQHHPDAHITLLTTKPYEGLARAPGYVDDIWFDERPKWTDLRAVLSLRSKLRGGRFDRVYDLQTNGRTGRYFHLMKPGVPEWSGVVKGASHFYDSPERTKIHTLERQRQQLAVAGIDPDYPHDGMTWAKADLSRFKLRDRYAVLVPGGSAHRPEKRWPAERYGELAGKLSEKGIRSVILGHGEEEEALADEIMRHCPSAGSLVGQTDFVEIIALGRGAEIAIGNDTGPMHLIAPTGTRAITLFSHASDPQLHRPRGPHVTVLRQRDLTKMPLGPVLDATRLDFAPDGA